MCSLTEQCVCIRTLSGVAGEGKEEEKKKEQAGREEIVDKPVAL